MQVIEEIAIKHGLSALLQEKPFQVIYLIYCMIMSLLYIYIHINFYLYTYIYNRVQMDQENIIIGQLQQMMVLIF